MKHSLEETLKRHTFHPVIPEKLQHGTPLNIDLSPSSELWQRINAEHSYAQEIKRLAAEINATVEVGRYNEERMIYQDTDNFSGREQCTLHIGIDMGIPAGNPVFAPLAGEVFGFADHAAEGDYGPTVILRHELEGHVFHTLYGHLARTSLATLQVGQKIAQGEQFATIGESSENGGWPTHVHFQIVRDMQGQTDDYTGVVDPAKADFYLANCPDPNLILNLAI